MVADITDYDGPELPELDAEDWGDLIALEDETSYVNLLVYGRTGAGKTVFGGSDDRVLFLATEDKGTLSAKRLGSKAQKLIIKSWDDIEKAYDRLYDAQENGGIPFNWVVIDSLTFMHQMCRTGILKAGVEENPERDPDTLQLNEWNVWFKRTERFVNAFNDLNVNVLYTCLVDTREDEEGNTVLCPDIQGSKRVDIAQTVMSYMTAVGCMQVRRRKVKEGDKEVTQEYRRITWRDSGTIQGKDRTTVLAPYTDDLTLKQIRERIYSGNIKAAAQKSPATTKKKETASA